MILAFYETMMLAFCQVESKCLANNLICTRPRILIRKEDQPEDDDQNQDEEYDDDENQDKEEEDDDGNQDEEDSADQNQDEEDDDDGNLLDISVR